MNHYPHLLAPLNLAGLQLCSRVVMGAMHTGLEDEPDGAAKLAAYYQQRAAAGVGLIITGGYAPNDAGRLDAAASRLAHPQDLPPHRVVTRAVRRVGGHILLQLLHAGRYAWHSQLVAPSPLRAPINSATPRELTAEQVTETVADFGRAAALAREAGYHGVEVMGSEGYLINQFVAPRTNLREDEWGGDSARRMRFPVEVVRACRRRAGDDFLIVFRLSMLDLVEGGSTWDEVLALGRAVRQVGADLINTGIGWHEARIPTIAMSVPRGAFTWVTRRFRRAVGGPVVATNRINTPELADRIIERGDADLVSMARPLLADPLLVQKARAGQPEQINTCVACNQACLDHAFAARRVSCLVNPRACHELELRQVAAASPRQVAVVGAGPAGLACATEAAERGHQVTLFESAPSIGGQLNLAIQIPGKREFGETLRYFRVRLQSLGVRVLLSHRAQARELEQFEAVVLATGTRPRAAEFLGVDHPMVMDYLDFLTGRRQAGKRVAIVGGGGIACDVAQLLTHEGADDTSSLPAYLRTWGLDTSVAARGGIATAEPGPLPSARTVYVMQRRPGKPGGRLGKTTGWVLRAQLERRGVQLWGGVRYQRLDDDGLQITVMGQPRRLAVDSVVICAGQEPERRLLAELTDFDQSIMLVGGAAGAERLDAKRAIFEGTEAARKL